METGGLIRTIRQCQVNGASLLGIGDDYECLA